MRLIIVPTDFSSNAFHALTCACEYFKYERSKFIIVHAFADEVYSNTSLNDQAEINIYKDQKHKEYDAKLDQLKREIKNHSPNPRHKVDVKAVFASLPAAINQLVEQENADLIVMGTKGQTADPSRSYGTNTLQVIKQVNCPVMGIPAEFKFTRPENILFPSDLKMSYLGRELKMISCLAHSFRSVLHLLHVSDDPLTTRQLEVKDYWEYRFRESEQTFTQVNTGNIASIVNNFIEEHNIDMVVMMNKNHLFTDKLFHSSTVDEIGLNANIPFLILQNLPR